MSVRSLETVYEKLSNSALSSPTSNFNQGNIEKIKERIAECGQRDIKILDIVVGDTFVVPNLCNNRSCENPQCQKHRGQLYMRAHLGQIIAMDSQIRKPKGYVFTDKKVPLIALSRSYAQARMKFLRRLLSIYSVTPFSIHMEIKLYPEFYDNQEGICRKCQIKECQRVFGEKCPSRDLTYLHFHVVAGFIRDIKEVRNKWGFHVSSESARIKDKLVQYVSKYASKTPYFSNETKTDWYTGIAYKLQMHNFSVSPSQVCLIQEESAYQIMTGMMDFKNWKGTERHGKHQVTKFIGEYAHREIGDALDCPICVSPNKSPGLEIPDEIKKERKGRVHFDLSKERYQKCMDLVHQSWRLELPQANEEGECEREEYKNDWKYCQSCLKWTISENNHCRNCKAVYQEVVKRKGKEVVRIEGGIFQKPKEGEYVT